MIFDGEFFNGFDMVSVCLWAFTIFFFGLIFYLRREDRREGYPLELDTTGKEEPSGPYWFAEPKTFSLPHNRGTVTVPHGKRDRRNHAMARTAVWPGAPYEPTGDPMRDGVGPASYAERGDIVDLTNDGRNRIIPFRLDKDFTVAKGDPDPRGMTVYGGDGKPAGKVVDIWVDQSEALIRYLEVETGEAPMQKRVLLPMPFAKVSKKKTRVDVDAIFAEHFDHIPTTKSPDSVTRLEEDIIAGYYGGGKLYASPKRLEPQI